MNYDYEHNCKVILGAIYQNTAKHEYMRGLFVSTFLLPDSIVWQVMHKGKAFPTMERIEGIRPFPPIKYYDL